MFDSFSNNSSDDDNLLVMLKTRMMKVINTASVNFKTGSLNINTVSPTIITTRSNRSQNETDMFSLGRSATLKSTHADLFGDEIEMDMSNLTTSYQVHTTLNIRIHKDHSLDHVIGDIQSGVQTRGMTKNTDEHGFISAIYEGKLMNTFKLVCSLVIYEGKLMKTFILVCSLVSYPKKNQKELPKL
ncbi:hypothetical protein Tco_0198014 [Tanacetum coccineum]